jgi:hypothetical protein
MRTIDRPADFQRLIGQEVTRVCFARNLIYIEFDFENAIEIYNVDGFLASSGTSLEHACIKLVKLLSCRIRKVDILDDKHVELQIDTELIRIEQDDLNFESFSLILGDMKYGF